MLIADDLRKRRAKQTVTYLSGTSCSSGVGSRKVLPVLLSSFSCVCFSWWTHWLPFDAVFLSD